MVDVGVLPSVNQGFESCVGQMGRFVKDLRPSAAIGLLALIKAESAQVKHYIII